MVCLWATTHRSVISMDQTHLTKAARRILDLADAAGRATPKGIELQLDLTRRDIATLFGMTRHEATLALNALKDRGLLSIVGSTLIIIDPEGLRSF